MSRTRSMPGVAMSSSRPTNGDAKRAPALAASSAYVGEKMSVMFTRWPSAVSTLVALRPSTVQGHFTTMFLCSEAQCRPSRTMPSTSVATTSAEMGPSTVLQISSRISSGSPLSLARRLGLVVTPSTTPRAAPSRISFRLAVSRKIFMSLTPLSGDGVAKYADALHFHLDHVPRRQGADAGGCPGGDDIPRQQRHHARNGPHQVRGREDELRGRALLPHLTVDAPLDRQRAQ